MLFNKELFQKVGELEIEITKMLKDIEKITDYKDQQLTQNIKFKELLDNISSQLLQFSRQIQSLKDNDVIQDENMKRAMNEIITSQNDKHFKVNKQIIIYALIIIVFFASISETTRNALKDLDSLKSLITLFI